MRSLLARLGPNKCGYLKQAPVSTSSLKPRLFTQYELGRHLYPPMGMYCAIDGDLYDLGRKICRYYQVKFPGLSIIQVSYLDSHPGGSQILRQFLVETPLENLSARMLTGTKRYDTTRP